MSHSGLLICDCQVIMAAVGDGICMSLEPARNTCLFFRFLSLSIELVEIAEVLFWAYQLFILLGLVVLPNSLLHELSIDEHDLLRKEWQMARYKSITFGGALFLHAPRHSIPQHFLLAELIS